MPKKIFFLRNIDLANRKAIYWAYEKNDLLADELQGVQ